MIHRHIRHMRNLKYTDSNLYLRNEETTNNLYLNLTGKRCNPFRAPLTEEDAICLRGSDRNRRSAQLIATRTDSSPCVSPTAHRQGRAGVGRCVRPPKPRPMICARTAVASSHACFSQLREKPPEKACPEGGFVSNLPEARLVRTCTASS